MEKRFPVRHRAGPGAAVALSAMALMSAVIAHAAPECRVVLSEPQRERFRLVAQACEAAPPAAWPAVSDALVASGGMPAAPPAWPAPPARESAHLQLFGRAGVPSVRGTAPVVSPAAPRAGRAARPAAPVSSPQPFGHTRAVLLAPRMDAAARRHDIDPLLLHAIAHVESRHDPASVSPAGARGLMQVMPATGARFGAATPGSLHHVDTNLEVSAAYLKTLQQRFGGDLALVLAAYNAGEGAVERHGRRVPPYAETRRYVERVLHWYAHLRRVARAQTPLS